MKIGEILKVTNGYLLSGLRSSDVDPADICTDSRSVKPGEFFLALSGKNFDGNKFLADAFKRGASGATVSRDAEPNIIAGKTVIRVKDTTIALQQIAAYHRSKFKVPVIAITGSNGKTTVKDMIAHLLSEKYCVLRNDGTKNNHIGLPQTLLKLNKKHKMCVLEFGTNHHGEIAALGRIAKPTMAVMTNIGPSHLEYFGDLDGVFREKINILKSLDRKKGALIVNWDDDHLSRIKRRDIKLIRYGTGSHFDITAGNIKVKKDRISFILNGEIVITLNMMGRHNVYNALAAIAVARQFGMKYGLIKRSLRSFRPAAMRMNLKKINGVDFIDDSYNSNPLSFACAVEAISSMSGGSKWVVAGDMMELGNVSAKLHRDAGRMVARSGINGLLTIGRLSKYTLSGALDAGMESKKLWHCSSHAEAADILKNVVASGDVVLLKGSRSTKMEKVLEELKG